MQFVFILYTEVWVEMNGEKLHMYCISTVVLNHGAGVH